MLSNSDYASKIVQQIAKVNFEPQVNELARKLTGEVSSFEHFATGQDGWFDKYMKEIRPIMQNIDTSNHPDAKEVIDYFNKILEEPQEFIEEFESLFPIVRDEYRHVDLIFSHNDIQENNLIYKHDL